MKMKEKLCLGAAFLFGTALGYYCCESGILKEGKKGDLFPVIVMPKCIAKKSRKLKKDLCMMWEDLT